MGLHLENELLKPRQSFRITLYNNINKNNNALYQFIVVLNLQDSADSTNSHQANNSHVL